MNFKHIWLYLLIVSYPLVGETKIIETAHVADVIEVIDQDTWFLVDLDNTLFEAKQALGHANWFYDSIEQLMATGLTKDEAIIEFYPNWLKTQKICPVKTLETNFVPILIDLQHQGIVVMGFTHRQPPIVEATVRQVQSLGIDFKRTAPSQTTFEIEAKTPSIYSEGILFVGDFNKKGEVFSTFLEKIDQKPKKVVFIDDKEKNVSEVANVMALNNIEYVGVYYTAIDHVKPVYNRDLADFQKKYFDILMSNEAAELLIEHHLQ